MEDGDIDHASISAALIVERKLEAASVMANYPDVEVAVIKSKNASDVKHPEGFRVNGESERKEESCEVTSDEDVLVIDEDRKNQRKTKKVTKRKRCLTSSPDVDFKGFKKRIISQSGEPVKIRNDVVPSQETAREDLRVEGELDNTIPDEPKSQTNRDDTEIVKKDHVDIDTLPDHNQTAPNERHIDSVHALGESKQIEPPKQKITFTQNKLNVKRSKKKSVNPQLTEYAQYLGLQPAVKFKCCKCSESSFPSLSALNEHQQQCVAKALVPKPTPPPVHASTSTNLRFTRKVYLCSACGTYYENWNLFLHMREVHRRFICLYCLGMFSMSERLSQHLMTKHNCVPHYYATADEFLRSYADLCYLMCCHCEKVFNEQENFSTHACDDRRHPIPVAAVVNEAPTTDAKPPELKCDAPPSVSSSVPAPETASKDEPLQPEETPTADEPPESKVEDTSPSEEEPPPPLILSSTDNEVPIKNESDESERLAPENEAVSENVSDDVKPAEQYSSSEHEKENSTADEMSSASEADAEDKSDTDSKNESREVVEEVRKVPKVTLKLPPQNLTAYSDNDSDDSEKLTMEVDDNQESECEESQDCEADKTVNGFDEKECSDSERDGEQYQIAGDDIAIVELVLDLPLDKISMESLLKLCLSATVQTCVYCNHARKIEVNGKQLGLHAIAEHRFSATVNSITAEELIPENFVSRIKDGLNELETIYFCVEEKEVEPKQENEPVNNFKRIYECFQCRYVTTIHKELYLHNRKMHAKTILLCIMCKSNFYSYSELICHLCPGNYVLNSETKFHCCICEMGDLPSAFRLMVHLRKKHHTCDVCLESCHNQSKLSNHVWKHKLHHLCYRCGIAYRNKPDITKHLFWKHGTESVLCKKCLQKKWPHVYHFCVPPNSFVCEECNLSFSKAVYLKVHKRLHSKEKPHACKEENCTETFISKKLLEKHELRHREPVPIEDETLHNGDVETNQDGEVCVANEDDDRTGKSKSPEKEEPKQKNIIDDIPALNLSESDSDSEEDVAKPVPPPEEEKSEEKPQEKPEEKSDENKIEEVKPVEEEPEQKDDGGIIDDIWDNFKNYQATIEKQSIVVDVKETTDEKEEEVEDKSEPVPVVESPDIHVILADHDYCFGNQPSEDVDVKKADDEKNSGLDHDYCTVDAKDAIKVEEVQPEKVYTPAVIDKKKLKALKKKKRDGSSSSSDSSSDSNSSSCTCGSNCSCSSSSGSSSSSSSSSDSDSSSSEGKRRIALRRERRKERSKKKKDEAATKAAAPTLPPPVEVPIQESDLDTDETETDEDFYDEHPQRLANKIFAEKRNQLMLLAAVAPVNNGSIIECSRPTTPNLPAEEVHTKKKVKSKKRKKKSRSSTPKEPSHHIPDYRNHQSLIPTAPVTQSPIQTAIVNSVPVTRPVESQQNTGSGSETDSNLRLSKRRRVPNKFYGYSSDDENMEKPVAPPILKWRKADLPSTPTIMNLPQLVPPITIKNIPSPAPIVEPVRAPVIHHSEVMDSDSEPENVQPVKESSDSSDSNRNEDSDSDAGQLHISQPEYHVAPPPPQAQRTNENLYCYCQCPYDEVSEMIACDGKDCAIEWFHFECVGIMVPPKGKWFCPDCRKKSGTRNDFIHA